MTGERVPELRLMEPVGVTYGKIALRMGAVSDADLMRAQALRREREWEALETILVELGVLSPELAEGVRAAWLRANSECRCCGRVRRRCGCVARAEQDPRAA